MARQLPEDKSVDFEVAKKEWNNYDLTDSSTSSRMDSSRQNMSRLDSTFLGISLFQLSQYIADAGCMSTSLKQSIWKNMRLQETPVLLQLLSLTP